MSKAIQWLSTHCKTTNGTTALSQALVAQKYNGTCINAKGYDVVTQDGKTIQVKARWWKNDRPSGPCGSWIKGHEHEADLWVFVGFDSNYNLMYMLEFTPEELKSRAVVLDKRRPEGMTLSITKKLLKEKLQG